MPQLNPAPWLLILIMSWLTLLLLYLTKTTNFSNTYTPSIFQTVNHKASPWAWPWP
uniref:ATP synthase complex subunit 8 n=1 Tax=Shinisaurus crocodilurus TaxID=52224 RepID=Q6I7U4_SHICO|nr:ATP synthase F0 subunit 8 [Shinisaurus crocodilurus]BAD24780.1 ATPase subunit 8 [Shinisaurus crocodilurus]